MEKEKFHQLLLHRRKAAKHKRRLLLSRNHRDPGTLHHFRGIVRHADPCKSIAHCDHDASGRN